MVDRAAIEITALPNPPPGRQARMRMEPCLACKRLRTTRRSRAGAARGGGTPCATSRGRWSAAWSGRTFFCRRGEATSAPSPPCNKSPLPPSLTNFLAQFAALPITQRNFGSQPGSHATAHEKTLYVPNSQKPQTAQQTSAASCVACSTDRAMRENWHPRFAAPTVALQPTAGHGGGRPQSGNPLANSAGLRAAKTANRGAAERAGAHQAARTALTPCPPSVSRREDSRTTRGRARGRAGRAWHSPVGLSMKRLWK